MDKYGFIETTGALSKAGISSGCRMFPVPSEDESVRFVTIETDSTHRPADVLNALQVGGLMTYEGPRDAVITRRPEFRLVGILEGSVTLEDIKYRPSDIGPASGPRDL